MCTAPWVGRRTTEIDIAPSCQIGNVNTRQRGAILECIIANARNAIGYCNTRQAAESIESRITNARNAIANRDTRQATE